MKIISDKKDIFTIPNILSFFRIVLAVLLLWIFYNPGIENKRIVLTNILILSAASDFLDGKIARKFNMVSELGKILDPVADKLTQGILIICLLSKYPALKFLLILFLIKETYMAVEGVKVIQKTKCNEGAMWYGKINTAVFYIVMFWLIFIPDISEVSANILIFISGCFMLLSFCMYAKRYRHHIKNIVEKGTCL